MAIRGKVGIVGFSQTAVDRKKDIRSTTIEKYYSQALTSVLKNTGLDKRDFDRQGVALLEPEKVSQIWSMQMLQELGLHPRVLIRSDHGGTASIALLEQAAAVLESGKVDLFLIIGADAVLTYTKYGAVSAQEYVNNYMKPFGLMGTNSLFALVAQRYAHRFRIKPEQTGLH